MDYESRREEALPPRSGSGFLTAFIGKAILLALTIVIVWLLYGYLFAFQLDFLGWSYTKLQPLTNSLYAIVDSYFPDSVRYKFRAAITDDLGQRALFLLILTAVVELTLFTIYRLVRSLFAGAQWAKKKFQPTASPQDLSGAPSWRSVFTSGCYGRLRRWWRLSAAPSLPCSFLR